MDMAPDRRQLQSMFQKDNESFKEYMQWWREVVSLVEPSLTEKELAHLFMDTVHPSFYEKMVVSILTGFSDLIELGMRIKHVLKNGKISNVVEVSSNAKKSPGGFQKKKEGEINVVFGSKRGNWSRRKLQ